MKPIIFKFFFTLLFLSSVTLLADGGDKKVRLIGNIKYAKSDGSKMSMWTLVL